ncbi:uncharacterized protein LOC112058529 isoform X2 [Bicyclus anynana]|uniref:Regulatory protein zeste n=1 Tax=Bicyclus anynana TaxID=110368 RepID=A0A6J1P4S4_BICAN|nr:uncharacterized protein LOC112058529 isoform X2 [Bicyclus anynana]
MVIVFCGKSQKMSFKKQRSNKKQIEVLVEFMSTHNHLATGEFTGPLGGKRADSQWQTLKEMLKEYGPDRSINQWKQTWKDIKNNSRSENAASSRARHTTGNYVNVPVVSDITNKVLSIIGQEASTGIGPEETEIGPYSIDERLKQRNELLSEQNNLLREQNTHLRSRNKIKRNRFTHRFF